MTTEERHNLEWHLETLLSAIYRMERCDAMVWDDGAPWRLRLNTARVEASAAADLLRATLHEEAVRLRQVRGWRG